MTASPRRVRRRGSAGRSTIRDDGDATGSGSGSAPGGELSPPSGAGDAVLVERLKQGDEEAFLCLLEDHGHTLRRIARMYATDAVAEEVVQETWIAVIRGLGVSRSGVAQDVDREDPHEHRPEPWQARGATRSRSRRSSIPRPRREFAVAPDAIPGSGRPRPGRLDLIPRAVGRATGGTLPVDRGSRGRPCGDRCSATFPARSRHASRCGRLVVGGRVGGSPYHPGVISVFFYTADGRVSAQLSSRPWLRRASRRGCDREWSR